MNSTSALGPQGLAPSGQGLQDALGHLTASGLAALAASPSGQAPPDLAAHVSSCPQCQDRVLSGALADGAGRARREPPPVWRIWLVLGAMLIGLLSILISLRRLV